jgi:predicted DCC family thiol-disulfide oxidoreductase YuxK
MPVIVFDGDCGFCAAVIRFLERHVPFTADVLPWQAADLSALGATEERARREMLWVRPDGRISGGAQAFAALLSSSRGLWRLAGAVLYAPPMRWVCDVVYRIVARYRHRLPGGTPACAMKPLSR